MRKLPAHCCHWSQGLPADRNGNSLVTVRFLGRPAADSHLGRGDRPLVPERKGVPRAGHTRQSAVDPIAVVFRKDYRSADAVVLRRVLGVFGRVPFVQLQTGRRLAGVLLVGRCRHAHAARRHIPPPTLGNPVASRSLSRRVHHQILGTHRRSGDQKNQHPDDDQATHRTIPLFLPAIVVHAVRLVSLFLRRLLGGITERDQAVGRHVLRQPLPPPCFINHAHWPAFSANAAQPRSSSEARLLV